MIRKITTSALAFFLGSLAFSQTTQDTIDNPIWVDMMQDPNPNYLKTKRAFDLYFSEHDEMAKGSGAKQFRRWEHRVKDRIDNKGNLIWFKGQEEELKNGSLLQSQNGVAGGVQQPASPCPAYGDWRLVGPNKRPFNQSGQPNGTGRINTVEFHPTDSNTYFACAPQGGLWKTTDAGNTWEMIFGTSTGINSVGVSCVAIQSSNTNIMYLGTGDIDAGDAPGYGVMKSTNGGTSWTLINSGMGNRTVGRILIDPSNSSILLASTNAGIYRSTNAGSTWTRTSPITTKATDIVFKPGNSQYVYAAFSNGYFYRSTNNGVTWTRITSGLPTSGLQRGQIAVTKANSNYVYLILSASSRLKGVYRSTNSGGTFTTRATTPNILGYASNGSDANGQGWYDLDIVASPLDADEIYVGGINIWKSTNGGTNWTISGHWTGSSSDDVHADQHGLQFSASGYQLLNGNDGGVYITSDKGSTWKDISGNISNSQIYRMAQAQTDEFFSNHGYQDNGSAVTDKNESYTYWGGDGTDAVVDPTDHKYIYGAYVRGSIYRVYDKTSGKTIANNGTGGVTETGAWVTPFILQEGSTKRFFAGYKNIWRTDDVRAATPSFTKISNNLGGSNSQTYKYLENSPADSKILYALRNDNKLFRTNDATVTTPTWTDLTSSLPSSPRWIESHPTNSNIVYLAANTRVYRSTDRGATWSSSVSISNAGNVKCLVFDKSISGENLYVGTERGVYHVFFAGGSRGWTIFQDGFPIWSDVTDIDMYNSPKGNEYSHVIVSTYGRGVWRSQIRDVGTAKPEARAYTFDSIVSVNGVVKLIDNSIGSISSRTWTITPTSSFTYVNGTSASSPEPEIKCTQAGVLKVELKVSNCQGSSTLTKSNWIRVFPAPKSPNCTPTATTRTQNYGIGIINVELTDNNSETGLYKHDDDYNDYSLTKTFRVEPSTTYTAKIKAGTFNSTRIRMYIDYDNNGKFESSNNEILAVSSATTGYRNYSFTTPSNLTKNQSIRMRIRSDYGSPSTDACANSSYGDAEDYSILYDYVKPDFRASNTTLCLNGSTTFTDTSEGYIGEYAWDFGAGASPATATGKGPHSVSYTTTGNKTVKLTVNGNLTETKTSYITVSNLSGGTATVQKLLGRDTSCVGEHLKLKVAYSQSLPGTQTYQWRKNGVNIAGETDSILDIPAVQYTGSGAAYSCIIYLGSCGVTSSTLNTYVKRKPIANFTKSSDQCFKGNSFTFSETSTDYSGNRVNAVNWSFGQTGATSTAINPTYSYTQSGSFDVRLIVSTSYSCKDTITKTATVYPQATLNPTVNKANQCRKGNSYTFTRNASVPSGSITSTTWSLPDGQSTVTNPTKTFNLFGTYSVQLFTATNNGCKDTAAIPIQIYGMPIPFFTVNDTTQCYNGHAITTSNTSSIEQGSLTWRVWNLGNGSTSTAVQPSFKYSQPGTYSLVLAMKTSLGCEDSFKRNITIYPNTNVAFTINNTSQCLTGNSFTFTNGSSISSGSYTNAWTFGDGGSSTTSSPTKTYSTHNTYAVRLITTSNNGCKDTVQKSVTVKPSPTANFTINDATQCLKGNSFIYTNLSSIAAGSNTYKWTYGDGGTATSTNGSRMYASAATYNVKLVATSNLACKDSVTKAVQVFEQSSPAFTVNNDEQCFRDHFFSFTNQTPFPGTLTFRWNYGNGSISNGLNGAKAYSTYGNYTVLLISTTANSCKDTASKMVMLRDQPKASLTLNDGTQCLKGNEFIHNATSTCADALTHRWYYYNGTQTSNSLNLKYPNQGTQKVKLVSTSIYGCEDSTEVNNITHPQTTLAFDANNGVQCFNGHNFIFNNSSTNSESFTNSWNFGDNSTSNIKSPSKQYTVHGTYMVALYTETVNGCRDTLEKTMVLNPSPKATFTANKTTDCEKGNAFAFTNTSSILAGSNTYNWNNGEGKSATTTDFTTNFTSYGTYLVKLIATSDKGCLDSISSSYIVHPSPKASFTSNQIFPRCEGETMSFANTSSLASGTMSYAWNNGNGESGSTTNFSTVYPKHGIYTLRLTATSDKNCSDLASIPVDIASIPKASFTINPEPGCANQTEFDFTSTSTNADGKTLNYEYIYGDGNTAGQANATHKYAAANTYTVELKVRTAVCADSVKNSLLVLPTLSANFSIDSLNQESVHFYALDSNLNIPYSYAWSIDDGTNKAVQGFNHTFASNRTYTIKLVVNNNQNCLDSVSKTFVLVSPNYKKQANDINFYIYPNPTAGKFTYKFEITEKRPVDVKLLTVDGRELWSKDWGELEPGVYYESLDFNDMDVSEGTYPFQIKSRDDVEHIKIIFSR